MPLSSSFSNQQSTTCKQSATQSAQLNPIKSHCNRIEKSKQPLLVNSPHLSEPSNNNPSSPLEFFKPNPNLPLTLIQPFQCEQVNSEKPIPSEILSESSNPNRNSPSAQFSPLTVQTNEPTQIESQAKQFTVTPMSSFRPMIIKPVSKQSVQHRSLPESTSEIPMQLAQRPSMSTISNNQQPNQMQFSTRPSTIPIHNISIKPDERTSIISIQSTEQPMSDPSSSNSQPVQMQPFQQPSSSLFSSSSQPIPTQPAPQPSNDQSSSSPQQIPMQSALRPSTFQSLPMQPATQPSTFQSLPMQPATQPSTPQSVQMMQSALRPSADHHSPPSVQMMQLAMQPSADQPPQTTSTATQSTDDQHINPQPVTTASHQPKPSDSISSNNQVAKTLTQNTRSIRNSQPKRFRSHSLPTRSSPIDHEQLDPNNLSTQTAVDSQSKPEAPAEVSIPIADQQQQTTAHLPNEPQQSSSPTPTAIQRKRSQLLVTNNRSVAIHPQKQVNPNQIANPRPSPDEPNEQSENSTKSSNVFKQFQTIRNRVPSTKEVRVDIPFDRGKAQSAPNSLPNCPLHAT